MMSKMDELYLRVQQKLEKELKQIPAMEEPVAYLLARAEGSGDNCLALLDEKKTLSGAYAAMEEAARKEWEKDRQQKGVCFGTKKVCSVLDAYYGLNEGAEVGDGSLPLQAVSADKAAGKVVSLFDML